MVSHSKDPWWYRDTRCLMVIKAGHSQSQWRRYFSSRWHFGQVGSCEGSSQWRYCLREGWWPDCRQARRTSPFLLLICFASKETFRCWYTEATRSYVAEASRIVSLMTWIELDREIETIMSVAMWGLLWLLCRLDHYLEWQNGQGSIRWRRKTIWSWWNWGWRMFENGMRWELHTRTYCLYKRVCRSTDGWHW